MSAIKIKVIKVASCLLRLLLKLMAITQRTGDLCVVSSTMDYWMRRGAPSMIIISFDSIKLASPSSCAQSACRSLPAAINRRWISNTALRAARIARPAAGGEIYFICTRIWRDARCSLIPVLLRLRRCAARRCWRAIVSRSAQLISLAISLCNSVVCARATVKAAARRLLVAATGFVNCWRPPG